MKMFLLFSHTLTSSQKREAYGLGVDEFVPLPPRLQKKWSSVPPDMEDLGEYAGEFFDFLNVYAKKGDFVLIQGDFGLCCIMAKHCLSNGLIALYATTKRVAREVKKDDKTVKISVFEHVKFRRYQ